MKPVSVEVVAYAPTGFYHCTHCEIVFKEQGVGDKIHAEQLQSAMPEDMMRDYAQVSQWVNTLVDRYGEKIVVKVIDAASIEGVWKSLRQGVRQYPAVIVEGKDKFAFDNTQAAESIISRRIAAFEDVSS
jgi:hypothetical protein